MNTTYLMVVCFLSGYLSGADQTETTIYQQAEQAYRKAFGDPGKLYRFDPEDRRAVRAKANKVLNSLASCADQSIKQKEPQVARDIMELFSHADFIRLETVQKSHGSHINTIHPLTCELWQKIRALEDQQ